MIFSNQWYTAEIDGGGNLSIKSRASVPILSGVQYILDHGTEADGTFLGAAEDIVAGGKTFTITYDDMDSTMVIVYTLLTDSPVISVGTKVTYKTSVEVTSERLVFTLAQPATEVYRKNRTMVSAGIENEYWLDKQGVKFGSGNDTFLIYHTPDVNSLYLYTTTKTLDINLDHWDDHRFCYIAEDSERTDLHTSVYANAETRENSFSFVAGYDPPVKPRLMLNPDGYETAMIWTEHCDNGTLDTQRASCYGSEDITDGANAIGGWVYHDFPITKTIFYYGTAGSITGADGADITALLDDLYARGFEICLHTPGGGADLRAAAITAIEYMANRYDTVTWIDHGAAGNREAISSEGLDSESDYYLDDIWQLNGTKYFWQYASQDHPYERLDCLAYTNDGTERTPLYWRHPTRMGEYISWAAKSIASSSMTTFLNKTYIDALVTNRGISITHSYSVSATEDADFWVLDENDKYIINPLVEAQLAYMAGLRDAGIMNLTTVRNAMDYWISLENVSIIQHPDGSIDIVNANAQAVEGFSIAVPIVTDISIAGITPNEKLSGADKILWFDLPVGTTTINEPVEKEPYRTYVKRNNELVGISFVGKVNGVVDKKQVIIA